MYRTQSERVGRNRPSGDGELRERFRKKRSLELSNLGALVLDRIALESDDLQSQPPVPERAALPATGDVIDGEFLVCSGGLCVPTDGTLRLEEHLGVHYILGHSTWERCASAIHAGERFARRINEFDPHELAIEALALADPGID